MVSFRKLLLLLIPVLLILGSCGGGDDDDSSSDDDDGGDTPSSAKRSGDRKGSNGDVDVPTVKDGAFAEGSVHIEYSGGKDFKGDLKGSGFTQGGFTLLTFASDDAAVTISFQPESKDEVGGLLISTKDFSTAAVWGTDCSVDAQEGAKAFKGEFECDEIEGIEPGKVKSHKVRVKGNFSVSR